MRLRLSRGRPSGSKAYGLGFRLLDLVPAFGSQWASGVKGSDPMKSGRGRDVHVKVGQH